MIKDIYIFRHGFADKNVPDVELAELTELGISQANELANKISGTDIEVIFSSPIKRCMQTAEIVLSKKEDITIITNDNLIEHDFETTIEEVMERSINAVKAILSTSYQSVAISTHSTIVRCILFLLGIDVSDIKNCELFHITFTDNKWHLIAD